MKKLILIASLLCVCTASVLGETEPNDLPGQANVLLYNGLDTGSLSGTDIYDWFYFDLPEAGIW